MGRAGRSQDTERRPPVPDAKRMLARPLPAARKRYARMIATGNAAGTAVQMWRGMAFRMTGEQMTSLLPDLLRWLRNPRSGGVSRVAKGADCKSAALWLRRFESYLPHHQTAPRGQGSGCEGQKSSVSEAFILAAGPRCGCSSMVEQQPSKLMTRVRFPSPAPMISMG